MDCGLWKEYLLLMWKTGFGCHDASDQNCSFKLRSQRMKSLFHHCIVFASTVQNERKILLQRS